MAGRRRSRSSPRKMANVIKNMLKTLKKLQGKKTMRVQRKMQYSRTVKKQGKREAKPIERSVECLKVATWNTGSGEPKCRHRKPEKAAAQFKRQGYAVVMCQEGWKDVACFEKQGYVPVPSTGGPLICFDPTVLDCCGADDLRIDSKRGKKTTVTCAQFKMKTRHGSTVLAANVHCGHYGSFSRPDEGSARRALKELREFLKDHGAGKMDKVIVAGDFNELGELMFHSHKTWKPMPDEVAHVTGSGRDVKEKTLYDAGNPGGRWGAHADHIWVGGKHVGRTTSAKRGDHFGSDHHCVTMWGV